MCAGTWRERCVPFRRTAGRGGASGPRSSRPSGVAKIYVPKEGADTPAVVVDEAALRDGEAAAAAEEARHHVQSYRDQTLQHLGLTFISLLLPIGVTTLSCKARNSFTCM